MGLRLVTPAATLPLSLTEAKEWLRVDGSDEDDTIESLIKAADRIALRQFNRQLVTAGYRLTLDHFPVWEIRPPVGPLIAVSEITYVDGTGTTQTLASSRYDVDADSDPGRILPAYGYVWPATRPQANAVTISYTAGYGAAADIPEAIRMAIRIAVAHWFELRGDAPPSAFPPVCESLLLSEWAGEYC